MYVTLEEHRYLAEIMVLGDSDDARHLVFEN